MLFNRKQSFFKWEALATHSMLLFEEWLRSKFIGTFRFGHEWWQPNMIYRYHLFCLSFLFIKFLFILDVLVMKSISVLPWALAFLAGHQLLFERPILEVMSELLTLKLEVFWGLYFFIKMHLIFIIFIII